MVQSLPWEPALPHHSLCQILSLPLRLFDPQGERGLLSVFQMQMAELLVSHGASLSARTSMDEMPIGKSSIQPSTLRYSSIIWWIVG